MSFKRAYSVICLTFFMCIDLRRKLTQIFIEQPCSYCMPQCPDLQRNFVYNWRRRYLDQKEVINTYLLLNTDKSLNDIIKLLQSTSLAVVRIYTHTFFSKYPHYVQLDLVTGISEKANAPLLVKVYDWASLFYRPIGKKHPGW